MKTNSPAHREIIAKVSPFPMKWIGIQQFMKETLRGDKCLKSIIKLRKCSVLKVQNYIILQWPIRQIKI